MIDNDRLTLRERLILRIMLYIVYWLSKDIKGFSPFDIERIMEEFNIKEKR